MTLSLQGPFGRVTVEVPVFSIGRAPDNTLVINDPNVSGHHAAIHTNMPEPSVFDLGSTNGTFVNGQKIERNVPRPLRSGDQVRVGDTVFTFEDSNAAEVEPTLKPADHPVVPPTVFASPPEQTPNNFNQAAQSNQQPFPSPYAAPATPSFVPVTPELQQPQQQPQQQQQQPQQWGTSSSSPDNNTPTEYAPQQQQQPQQQQFQQSQQQQPQQQWEARGSSPDNSAPTEYVPQQQWGTSSSSPNNNAPTEYVQPVQPVQPWANNPGVPVTPSYPNQMAPQSYPNNATPSYPGVSVTPNQSYPNAVNPQGYQYNQFPMQPGQQFPQQPGMQQPRKKMSGGMKALLIIVAVLVVLGVAGGSIAGYLLTRPKPVISVTSQYKVGSNYAGSTSTSFSVKGQKFTGTSAVTFLLDGNPVPGGKAVQSDKDGNVTTTLDVTDAWTVGSHTLTAKDADGYTTKDGVSVNVVAQGQAHTPGPNGAPSDDSSYVLRVTVQESGSSNALEFLSVTGKPDPAGGTVCDPLEDSGVAHTISGKSTNGVTYKETISLTCSGTYKAGKVTYDEKATKDAISFSNGLNCTVQTPYTFQHLDGTFSSATAASGNFSRDSVTVNCDHGVGIQQLNGRQGTWTGQI